MLNLATSMQSFYLNGIHNYIFFENHFYGKLKITCILCVCPLYKHTPILRKMV